MARPEDPTARERILDAAHPLFYERGIRAVGMAEVVAAAGTGKQALYRHFPGKDELVLAYLERFAELLDASTARTLDGLEGADGLRALIRLVERRVGARGYAGCPFRNYLREMRDPRDRPGRFALRQVRALRRLVERYAAEAGVADPGALAEEVWLIVEGVYAGAPYPERRAMAAAAVGRVDALLI
ncbi:TetR/AcrR family transcriptional regulator [Nocardioides mangrovi]|uniref:TetR/AcrR family transcriptional regulator n=1 Tax=Nocardioides mangrovi TaxID=2874580 RepID=A0ABS7UI55_9ACTN|nr:TetR/AcrR family transcriptional regulator [Nocardioides mangrovi]MBZ5740709.1 TetR/AcrR family transcriptional regulator [Nocardioides mangrovi]